MTVELKDLLFEKDWTDWRRGNCCSWRELEQSERWLANEAGERAANVRPVRANAEVFDVLATACGRELNERTAVREAIAKD